MTNQNNGLYELYIEELRGIPIEQYSEQIVFDDSSNRNTNTSTINSAYINAMQGITEAMELARNGLGNINETLPDYLMSNNMVYYDNTPKTTYTRPKVQTLPYRNVGYSQPISSQNRVDYINKPNTTGYVKFNNLPRSNQEITMEVKKKPQRQEIDYKAREEKLNPYANEESQIRNKVKKYPLLDNTIRQQNANYNYQEPRTPLMGDSDYVPVNLYQKEQDMKFEKLKQAILKRDLEKAIEMKRQADVLYGSDEEYYKKYYPDREVPKEGYLTGAAASVFDSKYDEMSNQKYLNELENMAQTESDRKFLQNLNLILKIEKGYNNIKGDIPTNLGVTQPIYNIYCKERGIKTKDIKNITIQEAVSIYYKYFWVPSGAAKLEPPLDLVYFDMYVNSPPGAAKRLLAKSNNDVYKFLENRKKYYDERIKQDNTKLQFKKGWYNRLETMKRYADIYNKQYKS